MFTDQTAGRDDVLKRMFDVDGFVLPEGQDVYGNEIDLLRQAVVPGPEFPHVGVGDRHRGARLRAADQGAHLVLCALAPQQDLVAHDQAADDIGVGVGERYGAIQFACVLVAIESDPRAEQNLDTERSRDAWHLVEPLINRVQAHAVGDSGQCAQVSGDLLGRDVLAFVERCLPWAMVGRIRHAFQLFPFRELKCMHVDRASLPADPCEQAGQQCQVAEQQAEPEWPGCITRLRHLVGS